ncbi:hypothetical protein CFBP8129_27570 [Xanthomonas hortorum pv. gardneri]|uniref:NAD-specific glutamate dehydrogenase n=1 Tax=Xanthomonas hortorum pv. gardneri TaxID=2754056 RepID=A0A6V7DU40_9XANT|nr:hypothetical protein XGA_2186 [Xanthomonas hortorum ATCC 19865]CAD0340739.1 hypothetical protein CFBP8129_27570 [Xanthomonas hortorum pv. gardneri]CAD0340745.1 hypothetical protein CFBP8129_27570 [Xanthomonas hortorum pv. gardneri]
MFLPIALDRGHDDLAVGFADIAGAQFFRLDVRQQIRHRFLHHTCGFDHLRQEHFAGAEQVADHVHAVHQRAFDHIQRARGLLARLFGIGFHERIDAMHQRMRQTCAHRLLAPGQVFDLGGALAAFVALCNFQQAFGAVLAAVEDHILHTLAQLRVQLVVDRHAAGVDDAHVHAGLDRMEQEHRMDRLAHHFVAAERKRHIGNAAGNMAMRQRALDLPGGFDEVHRVVVVLLDTGGHGKDIRVEDDVFRRKSHLLGQHLVGARADLDLARTGVGLAHFIEGHHHCGGAIAQHLARLFDELCFAFLERDRIDHALALQALQAGFDHAPLGRIHHHWNTRDIWLGHDQVEKARHRFFGIDQALVHVDVEDLRAAGNLLACDFYRFFVALFLDQLAELRAAGDVGALADVDEQQIRGDDQRFQAGQAGIAELVVHARIRNGVAHAKARDTLAEKVSLVSLSLMRLARKR